MIVIAKKVGQLANRMLLFAHFIGAAIEHGFTLLNPAFLTYAHYFPATAQDLLCGFPARRRLRPRQTLRRYVYAATLAGGEVLHILQWAGLPVGLIRLQRDQSMKLDSPAFLEQARRHRLLFVQDWYFRAPAYCERHRETIRAFFTPWPHHLANVQAVVEPARQLGRFLVGVHIRRGDFARFKDGRYYYSHEMYREVMERAQAAFPAEAVSFLVCSDEPAPVEVFAGLDVIYGSGHPLEDLYALAACDRLVGPPSTYNMWASYYGNVPRYRIEDPAAPVTPASFEISHNLMRA